MLNHLRDPRRASDADEPAGTLAVKRQLWLGTLQSDSKYIHGMDLHGIVGTAGEAGSEMAFSDDGMSHWVMYRRSNLYVLLADLIGRET